MGVYSKAYELKNALLESQELKEYLEAYKKVMDNDADKKTFEDYRKLQMEIQASQYYGKQPDNELTDQLEKLNSIITANPNINRLLQCEYRYCKLMNDILRIIYEAVYQAK